MSKTLSLKPSAAICLQILLAVIVMAGVALPMKASFYPLAVYVAFGVVLLNAALGGSLPMARLFTRSKDKGKRTQALRALIWTVYLTLYMTSCLLCPRLNIGIFHTQNPLWVWLGVACALGGTVVLLMPVRPAARSGSVSLPVISGGTPLQKLVEYPRYTALICTMAGFSLANLAWFPLTAIPGILVVAAWQIKTEDLGVSGQESGKIEDSKSVE